MLYRGDGLLYSKSSYGEYLLYSIYSVGKICYIANLPGDGLLYTTLPGGVLQGGGLLYTTGVNIQWIFR